MGRIISIDGLPVKDAAKSLILTVTKEDVKNGKRKSENDCAAAVACKRQFKATEARIHLGRTYLRFNGHFKRYHTPPGMRTEMIAFDKGGSFEPGNYLLRKMAPHRATDHLRKRKTGPRKTKKRGVYHILKNVRPNARVA